LTMNWLLDTSDSFLKTSGGNPSTGFYILRVISTRIELNNN
jgi:hypothetical protein